MIFTRSLSALPREGTLHVVAGPPQGGWTAIALAAHAMRDEPTAAVNRLVIVGPSSAASIARSLGIAPAAVVQPPLGMPGFLARQLRRRVANSSRAPIESVVWGSSLALAVHMAIPSAGRIVHTNPPERSDELCAAAAARFWLGLLESDRTRVREELGIPDDAFVVLAGGDSADAIDAMASYAVVGRAAFPGTVLIVPAHARSTALARRYAAASGQHRSLVALEHAEVPSRLWNAVDAMLLRRPVGRPHDAWWGLCAWWALAGGIGIIAESCGPGVDGVAHFAPGDLARGAELILARARLRQECRGRSAPTHP